MKKSVTEERTFCDICEEELARHKCVECDAEICYDHTITAKFGFWEEGAGYRTANFYLCPTCFAKRLQEALEGLVGKSKSWDHVGQNPEYNERVLADIFNLIGVTHPTHQRPQR